MGQFLNLGIDFEQIILELLSGEVYLVPHVNENPEILLKNTLLTQMAAILSFEVVAVTVERK